jgi:hypothetical protein
MIDIIPVVRELYIREKQEGFRLQGYIQCDFCEQYILGPPTVTF